jgi:hypothetical protein
MQIYAIENTEIKTNHPFILLIIVILFSSIMHITCCLDRMSDPERAKKIVLTHILLLFSRKVDVLHRAHLSSCFHLRRKKLDKQMEIGAPR